MKCDELKRIESDSADTVLSCFQDVYEADAVDEAIAELKDKCQMHDFFWEGNGFEKMGFKNAIAVAEYIEDLEKQNAELLKYKKDIDELREAFNKPARIMPYVSDTDYLHKILERLDSLDSIINNIKKYIVPQEIKL